MTSSQKKIGIVVIVAIICVAAFYFLYWIKTPTYSLGLVREAVQKHDIEMFEKHVDLDTLYTKGFDEAIVAVNKIQAGTVLSNPLAAGFIQVLKPTVVSALKDKTIAAVKGEAEGDQDKPKQQGGDADNFAKRLKAMSGISNSAFDHASVISKEGNVAIVSIKLHNQKVDKDFELKVKMAKLDDGTWKVKEITNLVDFLVSADKAEKDKIEELNKPIREKMQSTIEVSKTTFNLGTDGNPYFPFFQLNCSTTLKNISSQDITGYTVRYCITGQNGYTYKDVIQYGQKPLSQNEEITMHKSIKLNEFIDVDNKIIKHPSEYKITAEIAHIRLADGTTTTLLNGLPDSEEK